MDGRAAAQRRHPASGAAVTRVVAWVHAAAISDWVWIGVAVPVMLVGSLLNIAAGWVVDLIVPAGIRKRFADWWET